MTISPAASIAAFAIPYPVLPQAAEIDSDSKRRIIAAVKMALSRLQQRHLMPENVDYAAVLGHPVLLHEFLRECAGAMDVLAELAVDAKGKAVVADDTILVCGVSLAQVRQLLIYTCAKKLFIDGDGKGSKDAERKLAELRPLLAFEWQLPLLKHYLFLLGVPHIAELGRDVLLLRSPEAMEWVGAFDVRAIRKVRKMLGVEFGVMLAANPQALRGLAVAQDSQLPALCAALGRRVWDFYARDILYIQRVEHLPHEQIAAIGPVLADAAPEVLSALIRLSAERLRHFMAAFHRVLGADADRLFANAGFGRQTLAPITQVFAELDVDSARFVEVLELKCEAMKPMLRQWLAQQR
jgi:hypothetical protein